MNISIRKRLPVSSIFLILLCTGCGLVGGRTEPELIVSTHYRPFSASYRGVSIARTQQQFDIQTTETAFGMEFFLRADVSDTLGLMRTSLTVDSVSLHEGATGGFRPVHEDSAQGAAYNAVLQADGRLVDFGGGEPSGSLAKELAERALKHFFPHIPETGVESGARWTDTLSNDVNIEGVANIVRTIGEHAALGWTNYAGVRAIHIRTTSEYELTGEGTQMGREFTISGSGRRHSDRYVGEDGRYLGATSVDTTHIQAILTASGDVVPIHQVRVDSIVIIP